MQRELRECDTLARLGGDEFAVLLRNVDPARLQGVADSFRAALDQSAFQLQGKAQALLCSVGVARFSGDCESPGELLARAELAYRSMLWPVLTTPTTSPAPRGS